MPLVTMELSGRRLRRKDSCDNSLNLSPMIYCEPCEKNDRQQVAVAYCIDCNEFICAACERTHRGSKISMHHTLLDQTTMPKQKLSFADGTFCPMHGGQFLEYYCKGHAEFVCWVCLNLDHRQCENIELIKDAANRYESSQDYQNLVLKMRELMKTLKENIVAADETRRNIEKQNIKLLSDIKEFRKEIDLIIGSLEEAITKEAERNTEDNLNANETIRNSYKHMESELNSISSDINNFVKYKQSQQFLVATKDAEKQAERFEQTLVNLGGESKIIFKSFQPDEDLVTLLESLKAIGRLDQCVEFANQHEEETCKRKPEKTDNTQNVEDVPGTALTDRLTEPEKRSHSAAEEFYRFENTERVAASDSIGCLKEEGITQQTAGKLKNEGDSKKAIQLLLMHGYIEVATAIARTMSGGATLGHCILVSSRVLIAKAKNSQTFSIEKPTFKQKQLMKTIDEGIRLLEMSQRKDELGELLLLKAGFQMSTDTSISVNIDILKVAWKVFGSKPEPNHTGLVECASLLIEHTQLTQVDTATIKPIINGVGQVFSICDALSRPNEAGNYDKVNKYLQLYGLNHYSQSELEFHPKERPHCLIMLRHLIGNIDMDKQSCCRLNKDEVHQTIMNYLLKRTITWVDKIWGALFSMRNKHRVCSSFQAGLECPDIDNVDNNCTQLHRPMTRENIKSLIEIDLFMIEFEGEIQEGASKLTKVCPPKLRELVEQFLAEGERDSSEKYKACWMLLEDLMPFSGHPNLIDDDSGELIKYLQRNNKVLSHVREFLKEQWKVKTTNQNKSSRCQATKETEIFLLFEFAYHLFGLDVRYEMEPSPVNSVQALERAIDAEGGPRTEGLRYLTLVTYKDRGRTYYEFIGKRFMEAYTYMYMPSSQNPYKAVCQFSKFVILQRVRVSVSQLPELHHYAMWIEFYLTVGFILTSKVNAPLSPDFLFVLPSNYLALLKFIEATFPNPDLFQVILGIDRWQPAQGDQATMIEQLQNTLKSISFGVSGFEHRINILAEALKRSLSDPFFYAVAERIVVLHMSLVLNLGKAMPIECESSLMKSLSHIQIPTDGPERLQRLAKYLQHDAKGIADVATGLKLLLLSRQQGEELLISKWDPNSKKKLVTSKLESMDFFSTTFFNPRTLGDMHGKVHAFHTENTVDKVPMGDKYSENR